jgi:hypothetical protein
VNKKHKKPALVLVDIKAKDNLRYTRFVGKTDTHIIDASEPLVQSDVEFFRSNPQGFYDAVGIERPSEGGGDVA